MSTGDWTDDENDAVVAAYFSMLSDELSGRPYNKAEQNRLLQSQIGRGRGSIEFKLANVSAAFMGLGLPIIQGYRPRFNFQMTLAEAVARWLERHPEWELSLQKSQTEPQPIEMCIAPALRNAPPTDEEEKAQSIARRFDVAGRDERNRALGRAGEERVFHHERSFLQNADRDDLARRVRWVSQEDGDGAGYDIASFTPEGHDRLIEVKTTNGWERTPFYISRNELAVADERRDEWYLFRLYDFAKHARAFELRPPLEVHVSLTATSFLAKFR